MFSFRRAIRLTAAIAGSAALLVGCSDGGGTTADPTTGAEATADETAQETTGEETSGEEGNGGEVEAATLNFAFWGNDTRAELYNQALEAFTEEYPQIEVNSTFLGFPEFWEKRQIEAAGGGLPDVMQFDYSYLRQYAENGLLLDLGPFLGNQINTDNLTEQELGIGVVDGQTAAIMISTNAWALFQNEALAEEKGVETYPGGGSWEDYNAWMAEVSQAGDDLWGGPDWTGRIQLFELYQRANGQDLFTDAGEPQFTQEDLKAFWELGSEIRENGAVIPTQRSEEVAPKSGFGAALTVSEMSWDNFGAGYIADLGIEADQLSIVAPPTAAEGSQDLYLKPSMLHAVSANTEYPEQSALLVDFLINSEKAGEIFGTNRGLPASESQLAGVELDPLSQKVLDYERSIEDRLGDAPPVPITGYGTIEEKFRQLGTEIGLGTMTVDQAVEQFFSEMEVILNS